MRGLDHRGERLGGPRAHLDLPHPRSFS
jgi:hypothetical protein